MNPAFFWHSILAAGLAIRATSAINRFSCRHAVDSRFSSFGSGLNNPQELSRKRVTELAGGSRLSLQTTYVIFFDYLTVALRPSMSPKSRFLVLVPALEGFHQAKYGDGPILRKEFKKQRKNVLGRIAELDGVDPGDVDFLSKWLT